MSFLYSSSNISADGWTLNVVCLVDIPPIETDTGSTAAVGFTLTVDGVEYDLGVWNLGGTTNAAGDTIAIAIERQVMAGQTATVKYDGSGDLHDQTPDTLLAFTDQSVTNNSTTPLIAGYWTTQAIVERKWDAANTTKWSNKGNDNTLPDYAAWQDAIDATDNKFNAEFAIAGYSIPPYDEASTSPYFKRIKDLATIWAGTELYFARGLLDQSATNNEVERDKMQGWRDYVDKELERIFAAGLDIELIPDTTPSGSSFQNVPLVRGSDISSSGDENSNGL
jgi:hypothetical protein